MKLEKGHLAGLALCVVVVIQTVQIFRVSHRHSDVQWRLDNMQLSHALVDVRDPVTSERLPDVRLEYTPHPIVGIDRDDLMVVSRRQDGTLLAVWVGAGLPVPAKAISETRGSADFELQPGIANLVVLGGTNVPPPLDFPDDT